MNKKSFLNSKEILLLNLTKIYLFPLFIFAILLKFYDILIYKIGFFIKYKVLKLKKKNIVEDWWISL